MERLPDAELEVMQALWRQEKYPVSSAALMEELAGRRWQTATLLKLLSRLEERGFVKREKEGRNNLYTPLVRREDYLSAESRAFLQRLHGGSPPPPGVKGTPCPAWWPPSWTAGPSPGGIWRSWRRF